MLQVTGVISILHGFDQMGKDGCGGEGDGEGRPGEGMKAIPFRE